MKRIESVKLSGINGERVDVVTFARWKKQIAGLEFSFALHLLPSFKVGLPNKLWISEIGTGFNTLVVVKHPVSGQHMTDTMAEKFGQSFVVKLAKSALHNTLKRYGDSAFVDGLVRAEMLLAKQQRQNQLDRELEHAAQVNCEVCEDTGVQAELGADGGLLAVTCKACGGVEAKDTGKVTHSIRDFANMEGARCETCLDSKVVCTTEKDHEGQPIEAECPVCVQKLGGLQGGTFEVSGTITEIHRNDELLDKLASEYVPTPEEAAAALEDADTMNKNMVKYGTIDAPTLEKLWERRNYLQERTDQHSTMTGDTTEQEYESLTDEIAEIDKQIHDLENPPCSK